MAVPMYRLIADDLRRQIDSGALRPGAQLKTEVELREDYAQNGTISRTTVRDAIKLLAARGLVETRPGQGTFVIKKMRPFVSKLTADPTAGGLEDKIYRSEVERQGRDPDETAPRVEVQVPPADIAVLLGLTKEAQVISRHKQRLIDGTPYSMQTTYYSMDFITRGATRLLEARNIDGGVIEYLGSLKINQVGWRDRFTLRPPDANERGFFGLSDQVQVAMLEVRRTSFDQKGTPIRVTVTIYAGDRNQFEMEAGQVPPRPSPPSAHSEVPSEPSADEAMALPVATAPHAPS